MRTSYRQRFRRIDSKGMLLSGHTVNWPLFSKILLALSISFLFVAHLRAQTDTDREDIRNRFIFGLKAGMNYSNVYDSQGEAFVADPKFGLAGGAFLAMPFGTYLGLQPEVLFSQKGYKATGRLQGSTYDMTRTTNYLDVPLFLAVKPAPFLTLLAGPQYSYLMSQTNSFHNSSTTIEQEKAFDNEKLRRNTICLVGGLDVNLWHLVLGARAGFDLKNNNNDDNVYTPRYKNAWYQATVGYRFYQR